MSNLIKPNLFIVGAPKAGTTSLYQYLNQHPEIFFSKVKEPNYFSYLEIVSQGIYYDWTPIVEEAEYMKLFNDTEGYKAVGEASVSYLFYSDVPKRIKDFNPHSKIIILLRDPTQRCYSHFLMDSRLGYTNGTTLEEIIYLGTEGPKSGQLYQQFVEVGLYHEQVKRYVDFFPENQLKIILFEDLVKRTNESVKDILAFLNVDASFSIDTGQSFNEHIDPKFGLVDRLYKKSNMRNIAGKLIPGSTKSQFKDLLFKKGEKPTMEDETKNYLRDFYRDDIKKLELLIETDLKIWYE